MIRRFACLAVALLLALPACSPEPRPAPPGAASSDASPRQSDFSLTIYSTADPATFNPQDYLADARNAANQGPMPGYGVVRETRRVKLAAGDNRVEFDDVAAGIDPTTVTFKSLTAPASTSVLEQNFEFDLASAAKLLQKYLGREVIITLKQPPGNAASGPQSFEARLLAADRASYGNGDMVLQSADSKAPFVIQRYDTIASIRLAEFRGGMVIKPTLTWKLHAEQAGPHDVQVGYQTDGLTWRADYSLLIDKNDLAADLSAWVTVLNSSGLAYPNAHLKLIAGKVQRFERERPDRGGRGGGGGGFGGAPAGQGFVEKSFFEYHLYTLGRTTSLPDSSTKQIELFPAKMQIPVTKSFVYYGLPAEQRYGFLPYPQTDRELGTKSDTSVDIYVQFRDSEKNGLGIPLPAGRMRVYKTDDADNSREFIGEDIIQHTPKDEMVMIRLGSAFDIVGERTQTNYADGPHWLTESYEIVLRNHKPTAVPVIVRENLFRWFNWEITASSDKWEKQDSRTIHFPVQVPAGGEKKVTYTVKYTW